MTDRGDRPVWTADAVAFVLQEDGKRTEKRFKVRTSAWGEAVARFDMVDLVRQKIAGALRVELANVRQEPAA